MSPDDYKFTVDSLYISSGCATRPNVLEWCPNSSLIIFASNNDICLADFNENYYKIVETIHAHSAGEITSLKLVRSDNHKTSIFITTSNDGEFAVWRLDNIKKKFEELYRGRRNSAILMAKTYFYDIPLKKFLVVASEIDKITTEYCEIDGGSAAKVISKNTTINDYRGKIILSIELGEMENFLIMFVGLSNGDMEIFYDNKEKISSFTSAMALSIGRNAWIRSLAFKKIDEQYFLASTFGNTIKIWELTMNQSSEKEKATTDLQLASKLFTTDNGTTTMAVILESILSAHEGFIQTINWHPSKKELLSSGADKKVIRWQYSDEQRFWLPLSQLGETGEDSVDYYDAMYSPDGNLLIYHSLFGGIHLWEIDNELILPKSHTISGHCDGINDICWDPTGSYILSTGSDKTTRLHTCLPDGTTFFEMARPQLHGHTLNCIASVSRTIFVSGGEEKIFRVFQANSSFARNMAHLNKPEYVPEEENLPSLAFQTELSLTNKPTLSDEKQCGSMGIFTEPPREDQLSKHTLFPEIHKLYGHGYEVFTVAANHAGTVIATSCKASHAEHATIFIWDTKEWQQRQTLATHQLTVTQMAFSKNDKYLLSTSRDRTWTLFRLMENALPTDYSIYYQANNKTSKHSRIIWGCSWTHDSLFFATVSRDKTFNIWSLAEEDEIGSAENIVNHVLNFACEEAITAVDFASNKLFFGTYLLAIGLDNGKIFIIDFCPIKSQCHIISEFTQHFAHSQTVTRIRFRPLAADYDGKKEEETAQTFDLASSSINRILKIFRFNFIC